MLRTMLLQPLSSESARHETPSVPAEIGSSAPEAPSRLGPHEAAVPPAAEATPRTLGERLMKAGRQALVEAEATAGRWAFIAGAVGTVAGIVLAIIGVFMRGRFMGWHIVGVFAVVVEATAGMVLGGALGWVGGGLVGGLKGLVKGLLASRRSP